MTNKNYFKSLCNSPLYIGDFVVKFSIPDSFFYSLEVSNVKLNDSAFNFHCFHFSGADLGLFGRVSLTRRCIHTDIYYSNPDLCKFSPYELREWCPAIFLPWTNYLHWRKYLKVALEIFVESNPRLYALSK